MASQAQYLKYLKSDNGISLLQNDLPWGTQTWRMAKHLAYEIQSHQMLHNDISLKKTDTKSLHLLWPTT